MKSDWTVIVPGFKVEHKNGIVCEVIEENGIERMHTHVPNELGAPGKWLEDLIGQATEILQNGYQ